MAKQACDRVANVTYLASLLADSTDDGEEALDNLPEAVCCELETDR